MEESKETKQETVGTESTCKWVKIVEGCEKPKTGQKVYLLDKNGIVLYATAWSENKMRMYLTDSLVSLTEFRGWTPKEAIATFERTETIEQ
jgi:hypothetical protein